MSNSFYNTTSFPATGSPATSASMRAELARIAAAFDKMPTLASNANKLVLINPSATGLTVLAAPAGDLVGTSATQTLTSKTFNLASNTLTGTLAEFNAALSDANFATLAGAETLTNKTLTSPVIGTIVNTGTLTLPTSNDTLVGRATTDTLTNKTISGANNTLSAIGNASLTNSAVTIGSTSISLGATSTTLAGLTEVTSTLFTGALTGAASSNVLKSGDTMTGALDINNSGGVEVLSAARMWTDSGRGRLDLWESASQTKSLRMFNANGYGVMGMISAEDLQLLTNNTARLTLGGSGNITASTNIIVANGNDSRLNLQVDGVTEGILTASAANVRLSSANAIPITFGTNGVTRLTMTGTGFITTGASEYVGIGAQAGTNNALRVARNLENGTSAYAVLSDGTFQSGVTVNGAGFRSVARTAASAFTLASLHHYQAVQATLGAGSAITTQAGFVADSTLTGATNNYGFYGNIASGTGRWNLYMEGTAANYLAGATTLNSTLTINGGTANGVTYLNGSKVLTTGSALTFDGTKLTVKGGNAGQFVIDNAGEQFLQQIFQRNGTANSGVDFLLDGTGNTFNFRTLAAGMPFTWQISASAGAPSEQMRLTSTGLGIGTSSPATKLDVYNSAASGISEIARLRWNNGGTGGALTFANQAGTVLGQIANVTDSGGIALSFYNYNSGTALGERMRLDSSGNLGLGVTPSVGYGKEFSISADVASGVGGLGVRNLATGNNITYLSNNAKNTGAFTDSYWTSALATKYQLDNEGHKWFTAPSGTAGSAISFTQAMTLDASGNLGIGTTSPGVFKLNVGGSVNLSSSATLGWGGATDFCVQSDNANWLRILTAGAERARIDSSGNLLVGTTSNATGARLTAAGGVGTSNAATNQFATVEYGSGASGLFTSITISFTVNSSVSSVILEVLMTGFPGVYLDHVAAQYSNQAAVVIRNNASAGTTVAALAVNGAGTTYTLTITTAATHPVVKVKATVGGLGTTTTLPTITFV